MQNKIVIAGGTGFIGQQLAKWYAKNNEVVILSRQKPGSVNNAMEAFNLQNQNIRLVQWDGINSGEWMKEIDGSSLVINLAGKSVNCRYTDKNKSEILSSRVNATKAIGQAIRSAISPPKLWINAASATIYRHANDKAQDEFTGEIQNDFSVQVCKRWEETFFDQRTPFTRKVAFRMAITLGAGGVMVPYLALIKFGLGGKQGSGNQMYSWVHINDVCRAVDFVVSHKDLEGVFNLSAPNPVSNKIFMQELRRACKCAFGLPASEWMLKIGARVIGTETELILKSRWVLPTRLKNEGFIFSYPNLKSAFKEIISRVPERKYKIL